MGFNPPDFSPSDNPASDSDILWTRCMTFAFLTAFNFYLLVCPVRLSFDWSMSAIPLVDTWSDARNLMTSAFYASLILMTWRVVRDVNRSSAVVVTSNGHCGDAGGLRSKHSPPPVCRPSHVLMLALALLILPFIPATNLFFYVGFVVAERVLYIPSAGYCLLVSVAVTQCVSRRLRRRCVSAFSGRASVCVMVTLLVTSLAVRTFVRNADWLNEEALYRSGISINPAKGLSYVSVCLSLSFSLCFIVCHSIHACSPVLSQERRTLEALKPEGKAARATITMHVQLFMTHLGSVVAACCLQSGTLSSFSALMQEGHPACKSSATTVPKRLLLGTGLTWSNLTWSNSGNGPVK